MSVINIAEMPAVTYAYEEFGRTALSYSNNYSFTSLLSNAALQSERYPCDFILKLTKENTLQMCAVDLKNLAENVITAKGGTEHEDLKQASRRLRECLQSDKFPKIR